MKEDTFSVCILDTSSYYYNILNGFIKQGIVITIGRKYFPSNLNAHTACLSVLFFFPALIWLKSVCALAIHTRVLRKGLLTFGCLVAQEIPYFFWPLLCTPIKQPAGHFKLIAFSRGFRVKGRFYSPVLRFNNVLRHGRTLPTLQVSVLPGFEYRFL